VVAIYKFPATLPAYMTDEKRQTRAG